MDDWVVTVSQNGWEYTGYVTITAKQVYAIGDRAVIADGTVIKFDESIGRIIKKKGSK